MPRDFLNNNIDIDIDKSERLPGRDFLNEGEGRSREKFGMSLLKAPYRIAEDIYRGGANFINDTPDYYKQSKTELPGAINSLFNHPRHALGQLGAGVTELGHNLINTPKGVADYSANRLNLIPQEWAGKVPSQRDISQDINNVFGDVEYSGEKLLRGAGRNALDLLGAGKAASVLNPLNLTAKNIAKDVVNTEKKQVLNHTKRYNNIWNEAEKSGFNQVPVNQKILSDNLSVIEKYKTPKEYQSLENFIIEPNLQNAQKAQSDMGQIHRKLEEKSRSGSLTSEEQALYKSAHEAEKHIEANMFKDAHGNINKELQDKYQRLTKSYRENVVPYKYNSDIQAYKAQEKLPKELVNALSKGEFAVKKGHKHRAIGIRNNLKPYAGGVGALGGLDYLYNQMFGDNRPEE